MPTKGRPGTGAVDSSTGAGPVWGTSTTTPRRWDGADSSGSGVHRLRPRLPALLAAYFAARRWRSWLADRYGWVAYAAAGPGLPLLAGGQSWRLYTGPLLLGCWGGVWQLPGPLAPVEWRLLPRLGLLIPYVALYFWAQMFLWWPLWDLQRGAWAAFLVLFSVNTALNLRGHFRRPAGRRVSRRG
ncbi:hypothetical protein [Arthrobacter sp. AL12]|uniref:hypothetical protein n=1 Tax=Arthrobacter sp. AL12 TaxID=3042241 RepID=UPI00249BE760|nr:hypothetical protein [Arthrobacter sp. AL12]MDI3211991.1 hypothetical protein [Arthrobacter sp. AL12]